MKSSLWTAKQSYFLRTRATIHIYSNERSGANTPYGRVRFARFTREDHAYGASGLPQTSENDCFAVYDLCGIVYSVLILFQTFSKVIHVGICKDKLAKTMFGSCRLLGLLVMGSWNLVGPFVLTSDPHQAHHDSLARERATLLVIFEGGGETLVSFAAVIRIVVTARVTETLAAL